MAWVSPDGHNDPDGKWVEELKAYDENTALYAGCGEAGFYLELTLSVPISCNKVQVWVTAFMGDANIDVDVHYGAAYHNIYSGTPAQDEWVEYGIGSTQTVDKLQVKWNSGGFVLYLHEADFWEVEVVRRIFITHQ